MISYFFPLQIYSVFFMMGVIWFVQVVHYPMMGLVPHEKRPEYCLKHTILTSYVVVPPMVLDLVSAMCIGYYYLNVFWTMNLLLLYLIWTITFSLMLPIHRSLSTFGKQDDVVRLVRINWIRTVLWSIRSLLLISTLV